MMKVYLEKFNSDGLSPEGDRLVRDKGSSEKVPAKAPSEDNLLSKPDVMSVRDPSTRELRLLFRRRHVSQALGALPEGNATESANENPEIKVIRSEEENEVKTSHLNSVQNKSFTH